MGPPVYRRCRRCDGEYESWVERCVDCDLLLDEQAAFPEPPVQRQADQEERRSTHVAVDDLSPMQRERLALVLRGHDVRFEMAGDRVWFPEPALPQVQDVLEEVRAFHGIAATDRHSRCRSTPGTSVRGDRRIVRPTVEPLRQDHAAFAGAWIRALARALDGWILAALASSSTWVATPMPYVTAVFLIGLLASFEWAFGRTPGKALVGLRVELVDGGRPTFGSAMVRNSWQLVGFVPQLGGWLVVSAQLAIGWQIGRDPKRRGPHDVLARTVVVRQRDPLLLRLADSVRSTPDA